MVSRTDSTPEPGPTDPRADRRDVAALRRRAVRGVSALAQRGRLPEAAAALARVPGRAGCHALFALTMRRLDEGAVPVDLSSAISRLLARADRELRRGHDTWALEWFDQAIQLAFHPSVHHGSAPSPLATDPAAFLAPVRASEVGRLMTERPDPVPAPHPGGRRVLVASHGSWTFADRVIDALGAANSNRADESFAVERFDLSTLPADQRPSHRAALRARWDLVRHGRRAPVPPTLAERLEGVDTLFVEWGTYPLAWLSMLELPGVRLVARLHRFEAFTPYPMVCDFARVDDLLFVSAAVQGLVAETSPRLTQARRTQIVRNPHDYTPFTDAKVTGAERTLIQVGWALPVKDVLFTLELLQRLRHADPAWRLLLVGPAPADPPLPRERAFAQALRGRLAALGDAVEVLGRRDDVPALLHRAGFVVSASRHEGTHESVAEGAMAGCVPIVRDWPEAARWDGAASIYPREWVVADVDAAVARVRAHADPAERAAAGARARTWVLAHRRPEDVLGPYVAAITGRD